MAVQQPGLGIHAVAALVVMALLGLLLWLVVTLVAVGLVAGWWHRRLARSRRVEDFDAH